MRRYVLYLMLAMAFGAAGMFFLGACGQTDNQPRSNATLVYNP